MRLRVERVSVWIRLCLRVECFYECQREKKDLLCRSMDIA